MTRPRLLEIRQRSHVPISLDTSNIHVLLPVRHCGLAMDIHELQVDAAVGRPDDVALRRLLAELRPDVIMRHPMAPGADLPAWFWGTARGAGARVVACLYDSTVFHFEQEVGLFEHADCLVVLDSLSTWLEFRLLARALGRQTTVLFGSGFFDHESFAGPPEPKRHDLLFIGTVEGERRVFLESLERALAADGVALRRRGGLIKNEVGASDNSGWLDWSGYRRELAQARICLNMQSYRSRTQIKGRIYESMACGTFCLTDDNPDSRRYIPNDLVGWFGSVEDCAAQVRYWLAHEAEREAAVQAARAWLTETLDYRAFWSGVLAHAVDPSIAPPTLPVLEAEFERLVALQPVLIRQQLALITELSRLLASGQEVERLPVRRDGARGSFSVIETEDGAAVAASRPCWDLVRVGERRLAYIADMDPLPLDDAGTVNAARGRAVVGHRDGRALLRILAEIGQRQENGLLPRY